MHLFLSHSTKNKPLVREIKSFFPAWINVWLDEERLLFGSKLERSLSDAINEKADYIIVFIDDDALRSSWVKAEIDWALNREEELGRVFILPVMLIQAHERMGELGLEGRLTINLSDFTHEGSKLVASNIVNHVGGWLTERLKAEQENKAAVKISNTNLNNSINNLLGKIKQHIGEAPSECQNLIESLLIRPLLKKAILSQHGEIPINSKQYYIHVLKDITQAEKGWDINAVATLSSELWDGDSNQKLYSQKNILAINNGATIKRLFVIDRGTKKQYKSIIQEQLLANIQVRIVYKDATQVSDLKDMVLFDTPDFIRAYTSNAAIDGSRQVLSGELIVDSLKIQDLKDNFESAWEATSTYEEFYQFNEPNLASKPPGESLEVYQLSKSVISCKDAANARNVPLGNELKTLILETSAGLIAVHLSGDKLLSLRKVKKFLESSEAFLANPDTLLDIGLSSGTVSAVLEPVWSMPHLVSKQLRKLEFVTTNNGTRKAYFKFSPSLLLQASNVMEGDFEKDEFNKKA
jgi:prolyl-tRNA editing enzyme YbaK/EbsC (Cys-tRNA(Pro) deacylase)